ncbi:hypothetical protein HT031_004899 [Scenedesmus sp. PABB004]|nr:hypothetical protein HT031_004899 [Scenedesmus sp. PABB004]
MATRDSQSHATYNPVTHAGEGGPLPERARGVRIHAASTPANLCGAACIAAASIAPPALAHLDLRAAVDHLAGEACAVRQVKEVATAEEPVLGASRCMLTKLTKDRMVRRRGARPAQHKAQRAQHAARKAAPCATPPRRTVPRQFALGAKEKQHSSVLYTLGAGYSPVVVVDPGASPREPPPPPAK